MKAGWLREVVSWRATGQSLGRRSGLWCGEFWEGRELGSVWISEGLGENAGLFRVWNGGLCCRKFGRDWGANSERFRRSSGSWFAVEGRNPSPRFWVDSRGKKGFSLARNHSGVRSSAGVLRSSGFFSSPPPD